MRTTLNIAEDALLAARHVAQRERISLGEAVSQLLRRGALAHDMAAMQTSATPRRGRFALLTLRDEVISTRHVRNLLNREGI